MVTSTAKVVITTDFCATLREPERRHTAPFSSVAGSITHGFFEKIANLEFVMSAFHDLKLKALDGQELALAPFKGQVVLVVNVASKCGLTPQYAALENLYQQYKDRGFTVLGLPCNQFAGQEPGTEQEIQEFCSLNYGVTFPLSSKLEVNGHDRHQLYRLLAGEGAEFPGDITWNFEKFLLGKDGRVLARFSPRTAPDDPTVIQAIEKALA